MEVAKKGIDIAAENMAAANSRIEDVDVATEMTNYTKNQILQQTSSALLAQSLDTNRSAISYLLR